MSSEIVYELLKFLKHFAPLESSCVRERSALNGPLCFCLILHRSYNLIGLPFSPSTLLTTGKSDHSVKTKYKKLSSPKYHAVFRQLIADLKQTYRPITRSENMIEFYCPRTFNGSNVLTRLGVQRCPRTVTRVCRCLCGRVKNRC